MMPRTPNYRMSEGYSLTDRSGVYVYLAEGEYIRPIEPRNLPDHLMEYPRHKDFNPQVHWFCFTKHGVLMLPKNKIREE